MADLTVGMKGEISRKIYNCLDLCLEGLYRQAATCLKKSESEFSISSASIFDASKAIVLLFLCLKLKEQYHNSPYSNPALSNLIMHPAVLMILDPFFFPHLPAPNFTGRPTHREMCSSYRAYWRYSA